MFISLSCFDNNDDEGFLIFRKQYHLLRRFSGDLFRTELRRFRELGGGVSIWNGSPSKPRYVLIREAQILVLFFRILDLFLGSPLDTLIWVLIKTHSFFFFDLGFQIAGVWFF